ncbi:MAG: Glu-tRNA(Gln) amidotransferase subunit GatD [Candidatus Njordarchaeota archaeon]
MPYIGLAKKFLDTNNIKEWDIVKIYLDDFSLVAVILPGPETENHIYLKLRNGYNIAYKVTKIRKIEKIGEIKPKYTLPGMRMIIKKELPTVTILHCGGTIASKVEYSTGAIAPAFSPEELSYAIPEIFDLAKINTRELINIFSENMMPEHWINIATNIEKEFHNDARGIIVTHGTDTLHFTASAIAFMLENLPGPIVFTGAMRSSDRPASDAAVNMISSVRFATSSSVGESVIVMHANPDDTSCFAHRSVRCIKLHSCRRDAFRSIGISPIALINNKKISYLTNEFIPISTNKDDLLSNPVFENKTALVYIYPGFPSEILETLIDHKFRGIVLVGTGLGHTPDSLMPVIRRGIQESIIIVMTTQCLWGGVFMNVYETGRKLLRIGVIPAHTMLPHVAYVKLGWLLGQGISKQDILELIQKDLRGEFVQKEKVDSFVCQ